MYKNIKSKTYSYILIYGLILVCILFLNIGFSAFQSKLSIENISANIRIDKDVRVTNVTLDSANKATSYYEKFGLFNISSSALLEDKDSYIIYDVEVYNLGNVPVGISSITINDDNFDVEIMNYNLKDKICENSQCSLGVKKNLKVKVSYKDSVTNFDDTKNIVITFKFGQFYNITYVNVPDSSSLPVEVIEDDNLVLPINIANDDNLKIVMNDKILKLNTNYTYTNNILTINKVSGDIRISVNENSIMKDKLINAFISTGAESDIPDYSMDVLTEDERKNLFSNIATESGLYKTKGITGKDVLFFRGDITKNYVQFAGYLWRIMQIDENGNLRLILDGALNRSIYQANGTIEIVEDAFTVLDYSNSSAKTNLDSWYKYIGHLSSRIVPTKFCINYDYITKTSTESKNSVNYFKSYQNIGTDVAEFSPSLVCPSKYTFVDNVGLISAEEYVISGGSFEKNNTSFYLYNSSIYYDRDDDFFWTLSPAYHDTARKNGSVFMINRNGALKDWSYHLLSGNYILRPVVTINGDYNMAGDGTKSNPYYYADLSQTGTKIDIVDLKSLNGNTYFIGHILGKKNVDGLMSGTVSTTLNGKGLLGKNTAIFSSDKLSIINRTAITFTFEMVSSTDNGYYYYIKNSNGEYLKINEDQTVELSSTPSKLKVALSTFDKRSGQIIISNEAETYYLNFFGAASTYGDDKFAAWNEVDENASLSLYVPNN